MTLPRPVPVGSLTCQKDSYRTTFQSTVFSCSEKPNSAGFYEIQLIDTILFPEGGGQPCDHGKIDNIPIKNVQRKGASAIHHSPEPLPPGKEISIEIDFKRRFDHMQQHSGQHLLSAILERDYKMDTVSWSLGETRSYVDLDVPAGVIPEQIFSLAEAKINEAIRNKLAVRVTVQDKPDEGAHKIPEDYDMSGGIRYITISELDRNACCGTHVSNLSDLQAIKFLHSEKAKAYTRLFFLVGNRIFSQFQESYDRDRALTRLLNGATPDVFLESVTRLQKQLKDTQKDIKNYLKELGGVLAQQLGDQAKEKGFAVLHRDDADLEFLNAIANNFKGYSGGLILLTGGTAKLGGPLLLLGNEKAVAGCGKRLQTDLNIKGGGKGRWQGKSSDWLNLSRVHSIVSETANS